MSADSPRRSGSRVTRQGGGSVCGNGGGQVVSPQPVTDPSIIDSVTGFINDVVPQAYTSTLPGDCKDSITWARFESADINDPAFFPDSTSDAVLPLILILGYNTGVQVWTIPANGEATEVLSWSQGSVRTLRILPSPTLNLVHSSDPYAMKRPLVAICDSAGPGPPFCSVSFISLKTGDQVKSIKFKNPVCDVYANRRSVIVTFPERIAVFDACMLEDRLSITSCYLSPGPNANPVALGSRWLAYAEKKLVAWKRSSGGVGGAGAQSYTATMLHAAQTLGRGLRGLSETVASSLTGPRNHTMAQVGILGSSPPTMNGVDHSSPGVVTVLDLEASSSKCSGSDEGHSGNTVTAESVIAHFIAHNEAIVALEFDPSGTLLVTADRRGHDFHIFRLQPHPSGSSLAAVHHLYVLHRGDTSAKVQNVAFSCDSRWVAVSTLRGTTHVFPLTPYGGPVGFRTHGSPLVVNRLSRFHRSAGLSADGRSSPVPSPESPPCLPAGPHANPRLPPYPHPTVQSPLSQLRQSPHPHLAPTGPLDVTVRVCAAFASPRAWLLESQTTHPRDGPRDSSKALRRPVDSLFVMGQHGNMVQYDLDPKPVTGDPREKVCDDTKIELEVEAKAQWPLQRSSHSPEVLPPLSSSNPLLCAPELRMPSCDPDSNGQLEERWLSQVEIVTHAGPHRRLWMGPQITFKTYTTSSGSLQDMEAVEVGTVPVSRPARSNPVNMPGGRPVVPVLIESGSGSSFEQSPHLLEVFGSDSGDADNWGGHGASRLREDLADAMLESPGAPSREKGKRRCYDLVGEGGDGGGGAGGEVGDGVGEGRGTWSLPVRRVVNPGGAEITMSSDAAEPDSDQGLVVQEHHWEAIAVAAPAALIPVPPDPSPDTVRQLYTTIAAAELQRTPSQQPGHKAASSDGEGFLGRDCTSRRSSCIGDGRGASASDMFTKESSVGEDSSRILDRESGDPPQARKKSKKGTLAKEIDLVGERRTVPEKADVGQTDYSYPSENTVKGGKGVNQNEEGSVVVLSKKGKKSQDIAPFDSPVAPPKVVSRKSVTPPKDIHENKGVKRSSLSAEKDVANDLALSMSKKNKKKGSAVMKESQKQGDTVVEPIEVRNVEGTTGQEIANLDSCELKAASADECVNATFEQTKHGDHKDGFRGVAVPPEPRGANKRAHDEAKSPANEKLDHTIRLGSDHTSFLEDATKQPSQSQTVTKVRKKSLKGRQSSGDSSTDGDSPVGEKFGLEEVPRIVGEDILASDNYGSSGATKSRKSKESDSSSRIKSQLNVAVQRGLEEAAQDDDTCEASVQQRIGEDLFPKFGDAGKLEVETAEKIVHDPASNTSKSGKKGSKSYKIINSEAVIQTTIAKSDHECLSRPSEQVPPNAWSIQSNPAASKDAEEYPLLPSRTSKKNWGKPSCETTREPEIVEKLDQDKSKSKKEKISSDLKVHDAPQETEIAKPTRRWEIPNSGKPTEMDIENLTFEDLEAIVDAACKVEETKLEPTYLKGIKNGKANEQSAVSLTNQVQEKGDVEENVDDIDKLAFEHFEAIVDATCMEEETKLEKICLKENKNGKRADQSPISHTLKTKGKENVDDDVSSGDKKCLDLADVIEITKPVEDLIKIEEPVKTQEKPAATPNRSSKAHRRKRR